MESLLDSMWQINNSSLENAWYFWGYSFENCTELACLPKFASLVYYIQTTNRTTICFKSDHHYI